MLEERVAVAAVAGRRGANDGDSIVVFRKAKVVHMGDTFFNGLYPFIDVSSGGSVGLHLLQGRNPARSASAAVRWNCTFAGFARRAPQEGRQYTPVVFTE